MAHHTKKLPEKSSYGPVEIVAGTPASTPKKPRIRLLAKERGIVSRSFNGDTSEIIKGMRDGTPASVIPDLAACFGMSQDRLFEVLRLPRSTMKSRISKNEMLSASEQDRMYRAEQVWSRCVAVLEDEEAARVWVKQSNRSLGGEAPLSLLDTEVGYELVLDTLGRIAHGVVS